MWISKQAYDDLRADLQTRREELALEIVRCHELEKQLVLAHNNEDWLRTECNIARARADALFTQWTQARVPTPQIDRATREMEEQIEMTRGGALPSLEDPGDEIAARLGIDHTPEGTIAYKQ